MENDDSESATLREQHRTLRELVQDKLLEDVVHARIKPGQRLLDSELAAQYGVSRGPVREALRALEAQGLVEIHTFRGAVVTKLTRADVAEIYKMRIELEGLATRLAVERITDAEVDSLARQVAEMEGALESPRRWHILTDAFHLSVYEAAHSPRLHSTIRDLTRLTMSYAFLYLKTPGSLPATHPDHEKILQAIAERNGPLAEDITREHLRKSSAIIVDLVPDA